jgi:hypothetical protein
MACRQGADRQYPDPAEIRSVLKRAITRAQARDKVKRNVVLLCDIPQGRAGRPSKSLTLAQAEALLAAAENTSLHAYIVVSLLTGARTRPGGGSATPGPFPPPDLDEALADLAFEITRPRNLVPGRPSRRYAGETKRPGGRHKTRKPGQTARLTPLTVLRF